MDIVITYVNGLDPIWQKEYSEFTNTPILEKRFRDWGTLKYLFRGIAKNMVVCGGENVFPESVEMVINQHPDVAASKVFGVPDSDFGSVLNAIVELRDDAILTEEDLMVWLKPKLSRAEMPHRIEFKKLEVLSTGKRAKI